MIKVDYKKTRRNRIQRQVRETYLHEDLPCGLRDCSSCGTASLGNMAGDTIYLLDQDTYDKQLDLITHMTCLQNVVVL